MKKRTERKDDENIDYIRPCALIGLTLQNLLPDTFTKTYIDNTSLTILRNRQDNWNCELFNCTKHLQ